MFSFYSALSAWILSVKVLCGYPRQVHCRVDLHECEVTLMYYRCELSGMRLSSTARSSTLSNIMTLDIGVAKLLLFGVPFGVYN